MNKDLQKSSDWDSVPQIADNIRLLRFRKGKTLEQLARDAGVSRTTLHHLEQGTTQNPRASTVSKIAGALGVSVQELEKRKEEVPAEPGMPPFNELSSREEFDRRTNHLVEGVYEKSPELFRGWRREDWNELYSHFGTGGPMTPQQIVESASQLNRKRETIRKLHVVLETHLEEVAARLIETLYRLVRPESNLAPSRELDALLDEYRQDGPE